MNEYTEMTLPRLYEAVDTFAEADSDKRYNAARREVIVRWNALVYWLDVDDEDPEECEWCGEVLDNDNREGDYCAACWNEMMEDEEAENEEDA